MKPNSNKRRLSRHKPDAAETPDGAFSTTTAATVSKPIEGSPGSKAIPEAVNKAVTEFMKSTFGTQDQQLQDRFLWQAANILPDFADREEQACDYVAAALRGITPRDSLE